jgi:hypothetical protein
MCIAWLLDEKLCRCLFYLFGLMCALALKFLCQSFTWMTHLLVTMGYSSSITVLLSICSLRSIRIFFNVDGFPYVWFIYVKNWYFLLMN